MANKSTFSQFLDDNTKGSLNKLFLGQMAIDIAQSDNKLKALLKNLATLVFMKPLIAVGLAGAFASMGKSIRALVRDSGALEAAMKRLDSIQAVQRKFGSLNGSRIFDFAKKAGRDLDTVTEAFSGFKLALQNGQPVDEAADGLREMGLATEGTLNRLLALQQSGANSTRIFNEFTRSLRENAAQQRTVAGIKEANRTAGARLGAAAGSGFVGSELRNTQNDTDTKNAIAPRVERVSGTWAKMFGGFSTAKSAIGKWAAENPVTGAIGEGVGHAFPFAALAGQAWATSTLGKYAAKMAGSGLLAKGLAAGGRIGRVAGIARFGLRAVPWLGAGLMAAELSGAAYNYLHKDENEKLAKEAQEKQAQEEDAARVKKERPRFVRRMAIEREVSAAGAQFRGDREGVVNLENLSEFAQNFESMRKEFGDEDAQKKALTLSAAAIQERSGGVAATQLARVGGGGEWGSAGGDVQKQIRDLNREATAYLKTLALAVARPPGPVNQPQEYDGL